MKKFVPIAALLALLCAAPFLIALMVSVVAMPAAGDQWQTTHCRGALPVTGQWRPPYQQPYVVTSEYGMRIHPVLGIPNMHTGIDLASIPTGGPVVAVAAGRVAAAGPDGGYGNRVDLEHEGGILTRYAHLAQIDVEPGALVYMGQQLGLEGTTGMSTGNHLHLEVRVDGEHVDPALFLAERGAPLNGQAVAPSPPPGSEDPDPPEHGEGGLGFDLPEPGEPRQDSLVNPPLSIPQDVQDLYEAAAEHYNLPWALLGGVGMAETAHGRNTAQSSAGARGLMQFMPATFQAYGVDGDGDGVADIDNDADSIFSAANYLVAMGATNGPDGVRDALYAYNRADWYVNDALHYAHAYGGGLVLAEPIDCGPGIGHPEVPPIEDDRVDTMLDFAVAQAGKPYVAGAEGPDEWDRSSLTRAALATIDITTPRSAQGQRDWLAAGNGFPVALADAQPGDLFFYDSYLGPNTIGHVGFVWDPASMTSIEALSPVDGIGHFSYQHATDNPIFEIWRLGQISDNPGRR